MTTLQRISGEIVPLSRREVVVLGIIVACLFQFALFFSPALAEDAIKQAKAAGVSSSTSQADNDMVSNSPIIKSPLASNTNPLLKPLVANTTPATTSLEASATVTLEDILSPLSNNDLKEIDQIEFIKSEPTITVVRTSTHVITAYNSEAAQTDASPCITANGYNVCKSGVEDTIAANFLKFGTKVQIPELFGDRVFVVRDRMNKKHPNRVDVWMKDRSDAVHFGVKTAKIQVIEITN
jgi:3D (Asp-Asp-Asp) domain-containing protein